MRTRTTSDEKAEWPLRLRINSSVRSVRGLEPETSSRRRDFSSGIVNRVVPPGSFPAGIKIVPSSGKTMGTRVLIPRTFSTNYAP